ncbi:MAG: hypothetical protein ABI393_11525 [Paralcaligenes sp.]
MIVLIVHQHSVPIIKHKNRTPIADLIAAQVLRVARRFALVALAGELATGAGLTGWAKGEASAAARECFASWLENFGGAGNQEQRAILAHVRGLCGGFEQNAVTRTLVDVGWLVPSPGERHTAQRQNIVGMGRTRVYVFSARM